MSWKRVKIGDFLKRVKQAVEIKNSTEYKRITIKTKHQGVFLRDVLKGSLIGTKLQFEVTRGQFILSKIDARLGAFGIVPEELDGAIITGNFWVFDVDETQINIDWFNLFTSSGNFYDICNQASSGTTHRKYLDEDKFLNFEIDLPELYEQHVFMNKYESFYISYKSVQWELDQQQTYLQLLRQTILQEAVQGKLTKQSRLLSGQTDEPATVLLKRIKAEKEKLVKAGKLKKEKELPPITADEIPFELPNGWVWCRLGELVESMNNGLYKQDKFYQPEGIISLRMYNIQNGQIDFNECRRVILNDDEKKIFELKENDILINRVNSAELVGKAAIIPNYEEPLVYESMNMRLRLVFKNDMAEYLNLYLRSNEVKNYLIGNLKQAISQASINQTQLRHLLTPLPPLSEQQCIVAKVQQLQQKLNALETQVQQSRQYAQRLLQAVLREAFEGKGKQYASNEQMTMAAEN